MKPPYKDRYGVWNVEDKPRPVNELFWDEVDSKIAASSGVDGWRHGPVFICEQAIDECIDVPAWLTGLDGFDKPAGADSLVAEIGEDAEALFVKIERLKGLYE